MYRLLKVNRFCYITMCIVYILALKLANSYLKRQKFMIDLNRYLINKIFWSTNISNYF